MDARRAYREGSRPRRTRAVLLTIGALACVLGLVGGTALHASASASHHRHQVALASTVSDAHAATTRADHSTAAVTSSGGFPPPHLVAPSAAEHDASAATGTAHSVLARGPPTGL